MVGGDALTQSRRAARPAHMCAHGGPAQGALGAYQQYLPGYGITSTLIVSLSVLTPTVVNIRSF